MELLQFNTIESLNDYLKKAKNVKKVKVISIKDRIIFYVLIDNTNNYQK